jgi:hypothetical protein
MYFIDSSPSVVAMVFRLHLVSRSTCSILDIQIRTLVKLPQVVPCGPELEHFLQAFRAMRAGLTSGNFVHPLLVARMP